MDAAARIPNEKHLEFIQATISRLASSSFLLKGWSITIVSGLLGVSIRTGDLSIALLSLPPIGVFWLLDAWYLGRERQYRDLYAEAIKPGTQLTPFSMDAEKAGITPGSWFRTCWAPVVSLLHGTLLLLASVVLLGLVRT